MLDKENLIFGGAVFVFQGGERLREYLFDTHVSFYDDVGEPYNHA